MDQKSILNFELNISEYNAPPHLKCFTLLQKSVRKWNKRFTEDLRRC